MSERCSEVDAWVSDLRGALADDGPPQDLCEHVAGCPRCSGVALTLLADLVGPRRPIANLACATAEQQIPDLVDYERAQGLAAGVRAFPSVWWHTIMCRRCDEQYRWLHELVEQPARRWAPRRAVAKPALLKLTTGMIRQMLGVTLQLGPSWGAELSDMVLAEEQEELGSVQVLLRRDSAGEITLLVRVQPPLPGVAVVALAGRQLQAPLDAEGCARFCGLPEDLFAAEASSELTVSVEPDPLPFE